MRTKFFTTLGLAGCILLAAACSKTSVVAEADAPFTMSVHKVTPALIAQLNAKHKPEVIETPPLEYIDEMEYKVGPGDVIFVKLTTLSSRAEVNDSVVFLTGINSMPPRQIGQEITRDGIIQVPIVGQVYAIGRTVHELREEIDTRLRALYKYPTVEVKMLEFASHKASVTGEVNAPKQIILNNSPMRVLELLEKAGGVKETADLRNATLTRKDGSVVPIDLAALMLHGDEQFNVLIRNEDNLNIPGNHLNKFFVFGEAIRPFQQFIRQDGKTLAEALNEMDINEITYGEQVYVIRGAASDKALEAAAREAAEPGAYAAVLEHIDVYEVDISNLSGYALAAKFQLQPRDVVFIPEAGITRWSRLISQLLPVNVTSAFISGAAVRSSTE